MMHTILSKTVLVTFILSFTYSANAHVALDYPLGGETFIVNQSATIAWHIVAPHNTLNWDLYYSSNGGMSWDPIQLDIPTGQLSYEWTIPDQPTTQGRVRVIQDNENQNYLDISMDFVIVPNTSPPILDAPASNITIECNIQNQHAAIQAWLNDHGGASATNYCGTLVWVNDYAGISNECGATGNTIVIFQAVDDCGTVTTNATLTIADTAPPVIEMPASNITVESDSQGNLQQLNQWLNTHGGAQASDVCSQVTWTNNFSNLNTTCGSSGTASVIFTVADQCGNSVNTIATFAIEDHTPPTITEMAHDTTLACDITNQQNEIQHWLDLHGGADAYDIGGDIIWTNNYSSLSDGCGSTGSAGVIFTATDLCGNSTNTTATITIEDHTPPTINLPAQNETIDCANQKNEIQFWLDNHGAAQAADGCSNIAWTNNYNGLSVGCGSTGTAKVIFTAIDDCGNSSTSEATFSVEDTTAPIIEQIALDTTIVCGSDDQSTILANWLNRQGGAITTDLCGTVTWTNDYSFGLDTCGPVGIHKVIFTATDECGNPTQTMATLTILDSVITAISTLSENHFTVYPNPSNDLITIKFDHQEFIYAEFTLRNASGYLILSGNVKRNQFAIPVHGYPCGVYFLSIRTNKGMYSQKVIIY